MTNHLIREAVKEWWEDREAAKEMYGPIEDWDTSAVTNMCKLFKYQGQFNDDISR